MLCQGLLSTRRDLLTRVLGSQAKKDFPLLSYASLAARDSLAMGSSFTLPPIIGKAMIATMGVPAAFANNFAQLFTPVVAQTVQVRTQRTLLPSIGHTHLRILPPPGLVSVLLAWELLCVLDGIGGSGGAGTLGGLRVVWAGCVGE